MEKESLDWRSLSSRAIAAKWCARGTPTYYVIDAKGVIRFKWTGYPGVKAIDEALEELLKEVAKNTPWTGPLIFMTLWRRSCLCCLTRRVERR